MVESKVPDGDKFVIDEDVAGKEAQDLQSQNYYEEASESFRKKSINPMVIGGLAILATVLLIALILLRPKNTVNQEYLQSLESRMQQLESKLETIGTLDQILDRLAKQERQLSTFDQKRIRLESTVTTQIDQIIKEIGLLHQKIARAAVSAKATPKTVTDKTPTESQKTRSKTKYHQVKDGETLYRISRQYSISVDQLRIYNGLAPDAAIYPGQKLKLSPDKKQ